MAMPTLRPKSWVVAAWDLGSKFLAISKQLDPMSGQPTAFSQIVFLLGVHLSFEEAKALMDDASTDANNDGFFLMAVEQELVPEDLVDDWVKYDAKIRQREWARERYSP